MTAGTVGEPVEPSAPRVRRQRSVVEMLLSIVLALEAVLLFFVTLAVYGLDILEPAVAFAGGAALFVLLLIAGRLVRYPSGVVFAFALQAGLLATGLLVPVMYGVGALFAGIFVFCFIRGRSIDHQKAAFAAQSEGDNA